MAEWDSGLLQCQAFLSKSLGTDLFRYTPSKLRSWGSNSEVPGVYWEELNCLTLEQRLEGSFLPDRSVGKSHCWAGTGGHHIWVSINLANTVFPAPVIPWDPTSPNFRTHSSCFQWFFHTNSLLLGPYVPGTVLALKIQKWIRLSSALKRDSLFNRKIALWLLLVHFSNFFYLCEVLALVFSI